jgi:hypothetical protein
MRRSRRLAAVLVAFGVALLPATAWADATYHTTRISLTSSAGGYGVVVNAHANGPMVYAHEQYQLRGAMSDASYQVTLHIFAFNPTCAGGVPDAVIDSAVLTTNGVGNANGKHVFTPSDAAGLAGSSGVIWTMTPVGGGPILSSGCEVVTLD